METGGYGAQRTLTSRSRSRLISGSSDSHARTSEKTRATCGRPAPRRTTPGL